MFHIPGFPVLICEHRDLVPSEIEVKKNLNQTHLFAASKHVFYHQNVKDGEKHSKQLELGNKKVLLLEQNRPQS